MESIPESLADITTAWLREHLGDGVELVSTVPMPGMVGILGEVGILTVECPGGDPPSSFIAKLPLQNDVAQMYNSAMNFYARESGWYRDADVDSPFRTPHVFVNEFDADTGRAVLLLEKVEADDYGDILEGVSFERHAAVVDALARQHGAFWESPVLDEFGWLWDWNSPGWRNGGELMVSVWPIFHEARPGVFSDELRDYLGRTFVADVDGWLSFFATLPTTLCHGDFQLDNVLFDADGPIIIDFQMNMRSFPGADLGWYLSSSLPGDQIAFEDELIDRYIATLAAAGGPQYSRDAMLGELALFTMQMLTGQTLANLQETDDYGDHGPRMRKRLDAFLHGTLDAAARWDTIDRVQRLRG